MAQAVENSIPRAVGNNPKQVEHPREPRGSLARVSSNLVLLSAAIVLISLWILYYTDWSLIIGGLAGVAGVFALLARFLTEARRIELQKAFEERFLAQPIATWTAIFLFASLLVLTLLSGTAVVRSLRDENSRALSIAQPKGEIVVADVLPGRSGKKFRLWRQFGSEREYRVKLSGLPAVSVRLGPFARTTLDSPDDFLRRPVVLVRPTPMLSQMAPLTRLWLAVEHGKNQRVRTPFSGKAVWIGCDADVIVPPELRNRWQLELLSQNLPVSYIESWLPPTAQSAEWALAPGDQLRISVQTEQGVTYGQTAQLTIPRVDGSADFPVEVVLDVPHSQ